MKNAQSDIAGHNERHKKQLRRTLYPSMSCFLGGGLG